MRCCAPLHTVPNTSHLTPHTSHTVPSTSVLSAQYHSAQYLTSAHSAQYLTPAARQMPPECSLHVLFASPADDTTVQPCAAFGALQPGSRARVLVAGTAGSLPPVPLRCLCKAPVLCLLATLLRQQRLVAVVHHTLCVRPLAAPWCAPLSCLCNRQCWPGRNVLCGVGLCYPELRSAVLYCMRCCLSDHAMMYPR